MMKQKHRNSLKQIIPAITFFALSGGFTSLSLHAGKAIPLILFALVAIGWFFLAILKLKGIVDSFSKDDCHLCDERGKRYFFYLEGEMTEVDRDEYLQLPERYKVMSDCICKIHLNNF